MNYPHDSNSVSVGTSAEAEPPAPQIQVQTATTEEQVAQCQKWLGEAHYLDPARTAGERLFQIVYEDGQPVAVLAWAASAWHLKDRDEWIVFPAQGENPCRPAKKFGRRRRRQFFAELEE